MPTIADMPFTDDAAVRTEEGPPPVEPSGPTVDGGRGRARRRVTLELWAVLALFAVGFPAQWIDATVPPMLPVLQTVSTSLAPVPAFVLLLAALSRRWRVAAAALMLTVVQCMTLVPWWVAGDRVVAATGDDLVVMAANLQYGRGDPDAVVSHVRGLDVDVLALSEVTPDARDALVAAGLTRDLPHVVDEARVGAGGGMILSRHPLSTDVAPAVPSATYATPAAMVSSPAGEVLVVAAHPVPPWPGDTSLWHAELAAVASWAAAVPDATPLVIAGDLNATLDHPVLRRFGGSGLRDAHREIGHGPVVTFPRTLRGGVTVPPMFQIDHVLSRGVGIADAGTLGIPGSDHAAVWATLVAAAR